MIRVGILVPVLNQFRLAIDMLASVKSIHEVQTFVLPQYRVGKPLSQAWNDGLVTAFGKGCDYVLVVNDDILLGPKTIDRLVGTFLHQDETTVMLTANNLRGSIEPDSILSLTYDDVDSHLTENPDFACFMVNAKTQQLIGKFDENFNPAYFEDNDYHRRILLAGRKAYSVASAPFYHYGSQTQNAEPNNPVVPPAFFLKNQAYYCHKWGGPPGHEVFDTPFNDPTKTIKDW